MTTARIAATDPGMDVTLGERVHQLMWRAKLSQTAVAPKLGLSQAALSKKLPAIESPYRAPLRLVA